MLLHCPICEISNFTCRRTYVKHMTNSHSAYTHHSLSSSSKKSVSSQSSTSTAKMNIPKKETILNKVKYSKTPSPIPILRLNPCEAVKYTRINNQVNLGLEDKDPIKLSDFQINALLYPCGFVIRKCLQSSKLNVQMKTALMKNITRKAEVSSWIFHKQKKIKGLRFELYCHFLIKNSSKFW